MTKGAVHADPYTNIQGQIETREKFLMDYTVTFFIVRV